MNALKLMLKGLVLIVWILDSTLRAIGQGGMAVVKYTGMLIFMGAGSVLLFSILAAVYAIPVVIALACLKYLFS